MRTEDKSETDKEGLRLKKEFILPDEELERLMKENAHMSASRKINLLARMENEKRPQQARGER